MLDPCPSLTSATMTPGIYCVWSNVVGMVAVGQSLLQASMTVHICIGTLPLVSTMTSRSPAPTFRTSSTLASAHGVCHAVHAVLEKTAAAKCSDV